MSTKKYIAVAGNIGAGKSTLVQFLAKEYGLKPFYEPNAQNPYLVDFYSNMTHWAFHSQVFFLSQRFRIHQEIEHTDGKLVIDRTLYEDAEIFATALHQMDRMTKRDYDTYMGLYGSMLDALQPPDLLIYLKCPLSLLKKRIALRGRKEEQAIPSAYLEHLQSLYEQFINNYTASEVLTVDCDRLDYMRDLVHRMDFMACLKRYVT